MEDVWWSNQPEFVFPQAWETVTIRQRHVTFAWGPSGGGPLRDVAAIELAITAGTGGKGTVWIDDLVAEPLPDPGVLPPPVASATSQRGTSAAGQALDGDSATVWQPSHLDRRPHWSVDFGRERPLGGVVLHWAPRLHASDYDIETSSDGTRWRVAREVRRGDGGDDPILMSDSDARYVRMAVRRAASPDGIALAEFEVKPLEWGATRESFFTALAADAPRGWYPRGYLNEQTYWTVVGQDAAPDEALVGEDGRIEAGKAQFSIEPFVFANGRLLTWADGETTQGLEGGSLPLPWVRRTAEGLNLTVRAYPSGEPGAGRLIARYTIASRDAARGTLYLAVRPFQVNPPSQFLNTRGGTSRVRSLALRESAVLVDGVARVVSVTPPDGFGAATFDEGGVVASLAQGRLPNAAGADDSFAHGSGALAYAFDLPPGGSRTIDVRLALNDAAAFGPLPLLDPVGPEVEAAVADWRWRLRGASITLPDPEVTRTLQAQIGWILVNRDGAAIQPGSRAYERSWIRDGSLTSTALLQTGHANAAREFIEWFAPYLYDDGKVPCCVDHRGSDPVPEHDSGGEFIYLVAEYVRHTNNLELASRMWPQIERAVGYLDSLRQTRRTPEFRAPAMAAYFGLLPPSISHEGYSAKPMHSYWDDFFALRGFADAAYLARALGMDADARRIGAIHDEFQTELLASIRAAMKLHDIDYIPGAADLGDFDATSTTIALSPGGALAVLPQAAVERTFERYWAFFRARRDGIAEWEAMTPYEMRNIGAFVRLGWRDRANELLDWFMTLRRPAGWAHWAEVVDREPRRVRFLGDMPHTWVGSDFVRSVLDMLAYERESDRSIVIGAGVPWAWVSEGQGVRVSSLSTAHGLLGFTMRADGARLRVGIEGPAAPEGGFVIAPPSKTPFRRALVDGRRVKIARDGSVTVKRAPAMVVFEP
jgi:hypothetical protein